MERPDWGQQIDVSKAISLPGKYEVSPDQTFSVTLTVVEHKGKWIPVERTMKGSEDHVVTFRVWTFDEMVDLRRKATSYDPVKRASMLDDDLFNRLKVQKLLLSWSFGRDNPRLAIHHVNGVLTDESWKAFTNLSAPIAERIISEMNAVLEYGL